MLYLLRRNNKVQTSSVKEAVVNCQTQDAKVLSYIIYILNLYVFSCSSLAKI